MSVPQRIAAIRRLFLAKLEKMPADMPHEERVEASRRELDKVLGPSWREEVEAAGAHMDPTGDMQERLDKLPMVTREEGYHGDDVPPPIPKKKEEDDEEGITVRIMKVMKK